MKRFSIPICLGALVGCNTPDLTIVYEVAGGSTGPSCGVDPTCADIGMTCDSVLHLRVLRPSDPNAPFISLCSDVLQNATKDLCAISRIELPRVELPRETLEVQVTVWPRAMVVDEETGLLDCGQLDPKFDIAGFPIAGPAFGGRAFYHPGDTETFVTLGCIDAKSVNACDAEGTIDVTSTVGDFENLPFSVSSSIGDRLQITIGEPKPDDGTISGFALNASDVAVLGRKSIGPTPSWAATVELDLASSVCIQVLEDGAQTTSALRCKAVTGMETTLDLPGVRLPRSTLDQVLAAIALPVFPDGGLTVGIVLDAVGAPVPGAVVDANGGTIEYINATRTGVVAGQTSSSGMFVSRDAPYGTIFSSFQIDQTVTATGGAVDGKVTVVILQFDNPIGG